MIVALAATITSLCALVVSGMQVRIMREEQRASVWPRLAADVSYPSGTFEVNLRNQGIGPAEVRWVRVAVNGQPRSSWGGVLLALGASMDQSYTFSTVNGRVLTPGSELPVLTVPPHPMTDSLYERSDRIALDLCYCSVYGECWRLSNPALGASENRGRVTPAKQCPAPEPGSRL